MPYNELAQKRRSRGARGGALDFEENDEQEEEDFRSPVARKHERYARKSIATKGDYDDYEEDDEAGAMSVGTSDTRRGIGVGDGSARSVRWAARVMRGCRRSIDYGSLL